MHGLIGRDDVFTELESLLEAQRLVTIVGPGGVGKTSVARAVVADRHHLFVELPNATSSIGLPALVAQRHGFGDVDELIRWLSGSQVVLVLDTCEHVLDGAAELAEAVLDRAEDARVIATSRTPLDLPAEHVHVLRSLRLEPSAAGDRLPPAVELFVQRAQRAGAPAAVEEELDAITRLCRRLDGLPLAIELAAARARTMSPDEMVRHLDEGVDVLQRPRFRGESRHRSLRATIDWSYRLLAHGSQALFAQLSVFPGWFDADLAHGLSGAASPVTTYDALAELVDHSLVRAEVGPTSRFALFDSTRAFAEQHLTDDGAAEITRQAYVDAVCERATSYLSSDDPDWSADSFRSLIDLVGDLVHATRIALDDAGPDRAFTLMMVLWGVVPHARGAEIAELGASVLAAWPEPDRPMRPDVVGTTATALREVGRHDEARQLATDALDHVDAGIFAAISLHRILALLLRADDPDQAAAHANAAIDAASAAELPAFAREMRVFRAQLDAERGQVERALTEIRVIIAETEPEDLNHMFGLLVEGMAQIEIEPDAAVDTIRLALRLSRRADYIFGVGASLRLLALRDLQVGELRSAAATVLQLLDHVRVARNLGEQGGALLIGAAVLRRLGDPAVDDIVASAAGWRDRALLASGDLGDLAVPDTNIGRSIAPSRSLTLCRAALESIVVGDDGAVVAAERRESEPATPSGADATLRRAGDFWTATFAGRTVSLRDSKGLADIALLLSRPGTEVHILDLAGAGVVEAAADTVTDARAMSAYRERIRDLQEDVADAEDMGDLGRSERAQLELDALVDQLTAASGLGGRARRTSGTTERARSTVTKRVRSTIKKIATVHPELGRHLHASISTGVFCSYTPEHSVNWEL